MQTKAILLFTLSLALSALAKRNIPSKYTEDNFFRNDDVEIELGEGDTEDVNYSGESDVEVTTVEADSGCKYATQRNTDEYIDKVLDETRSKIPDPAFLPERVGRFKLYNGTVENLATVKRTGYAMVRCSDTNFSFLVPVSLTNLTGLYFWEMDTGMSVFRGYIDMFVGNVEADVLYTRQRKTAGHSLSHLQQKAVVEQFKITKLEGVRVKFDGLGPANRLASRLANLAAKYFSRGVSRALEGPVRNAINKELRNVEKYEKYYF